MSSPTISGRVPNWLTGTYFAAVLAIAGIGSTLAAIDPTGWLHWPLYAALPAVLMLELSSVSLFARADYRRRLGERAVAYRVLGVAVGCLAISVNWFGHVTHSAIAAAFFAGFSALGLTTALLLSGDRRRDQLRADNRLPKPAQTYSLFDWLTHPALTVRARRLAADDPSLGRAGSIAMAQRRVAVAAQTRAIAALLHRKLAEGRDPLAADIAVATYDLNEIAQRLADSADYAGLTAILAADLTPARVAGADAIEGKPTPAVESTKTPPAAPLSGEIIPAQPLRRREATSAELALWARALKKEDPKRTNKDLAEIVGVHPKTIGTYLAAPTGEFPIVKSTGKPPADRPAPDVQMGFQPPQS